MKYCSILFLFFVLTLAGCGEKSVTLPEQPLSTNPKDYMWNGGVGSEYVYTQTFYSYDSLSTDTSISTYSYIIRNLDARVDSVRRGIAVESRGGLTVDTLWYLPSDTGFIAANVINGKLLESIILPQPIAVGTRFRVYGILGQSAELTIGAVDEKVVTPSGTYRCVRVDQEKDTVPVSLNNGTIIGYYIAISSRWYAPSVNMVKTYFESVYQQNKTDTTVGWVRPKSTKQTSVLSAIRKQ